MIVSKFERRGAQKKKELKKFLKKIEKKAPRGLIKTNAEVAKDK